MVMIPLILRLVALAVVTAGTVVATESRLDRWRTVMRPELREVESRLQRLRAEWERLPEGPDRPDFSLPGYRSEAAAMAETEKWVQVDLGRVMPVDDIVIIPAVVPSPTGAAVALGFPRRFVVELSARGDFSDRWTVGDFGTQEFPDPGLAPVVLRKVGRAARYVRVTATELRGEPDNYFFALGELAVTSGNRNVAQGAVVQALDAFESPRWKPPALTDGRSVAGRPVEARQQPTNGYHGREETRADVRQWVQVDLGAVVPIDEVRLIPARPVDFPDTIGFGFPERFRVEVSSDPSFAATVFLADHRLDDYPNPGDRRVVLPGRGREARFVRFTAEKLWPRLRGPEDFIFALAEMEVFSGGRNVALDKPVSESSPLVPASSFWAPAYLVDGVAPREEVGTYADWLAALARRQVLASEIAGLAQRAEILRDEAEGRMAAAGGALAGCVALAGLVAVWGGRIRQRRQTRALRARIARDLHDEIGSNLSSIGLLSQLGIDAAPDARTMRTELEAIRRVAAQTADSMHDIVWLISPGTKTIGDLSARLRETAGLLLAGVRWTMEVEGLDSGARLPLESQRDLFLIFKEALHNIQRHARAEHVTIRLTRTGRRFTLGVADDGCGFDPSSAAGHGLSNMRARADSCGGWMSLESEPGRGTVISVSLPCDA
jgi:signal transduction histidine kinase